MIWTMLACILSVALLGAQSLSLHAFASKGKYGFKDEEGAVRIPASYDGAANFTEGLAAAAILSGEEVYSGGARGKQCFVKTRAWGFIDPAGRQVIPFRYAEARSFSEGKAAVRSGTKWGFIDRSGRWVVKPEFEEAGDFHGGLARVSPTKNGPAGYVNASATLVIPAQYRRRWPNGDFSDGVAAVQAPDGQFLLIDPNGRVVGRAKKALQLLGEGMVSYRHLDRGQYGLMDVSGRIVTQPMYDRISAFSESLAAVTVKGRWSFVDRTGRVAFPLAADSAREFHEGLAAIEAKGRTGYIDRAGRIVIPQRFLKGGDFSGGLASACIETGVPPNEPGEPPDFRCGYIDKIGMFAITPRFSEARSFDGPWALTRDPLFSRDLLINRAGRIVDRPDWRNEPRLEPFGQCQVEPPPRLPSPSEPPPAPSPQPADYHVDFSLSSNPAGASVYLVPLWDWQTHQDGRRLLGDAGALQTYLVAEGVTPLKSIRLKSQVYMAVFDLSGKRKVVRVGVTPTGPRSVSMSF